MKFYVYIQITNKDITLLYFQLSYRCYEVFSNWWKYPFLKFSLTHCRIFSPKKELEYFHIINNSKWNSSINKETDNEIFPLTPIQIMEQAPAGFSGIICKQDNAWWRVTWAKLINMQRPGRDRPLRGHQTCRYLSVVLCIGLSHTCTSIHVIEIRYPIR